MKARSQTPSARRHRRLYAKRKAAGLCVRCETPTAGTSWCGARVAYKHDRERGPKEKTDE